METYTDRADGPQERPSHDAHTARASRPVESVPGTSVAAPALDPVEALRRERDPIARVLDASPVGILIVEQEGRITFANPRAEEILGLPAEEILRRTYDAPEWQLTTYEGLPFPREELAPFRVLALGAPVFDARYAVRHPDGHRVLLSVNGARLPASEGSGHSVVLTLEDVTERRHMHNVLRLTQFSVDRAADPVFWVNPDARFLYANDAACTAVGCTREELLGLRVHDINPDMDDATWMRIWERLKHQGSISRETHHRARNGQVRPVEILANYLEYNGREYSFAYAHDISERKRAEEERHRLEARIRQTQKLEGLGVLAGGIAHEFNNILMAILGHAELALMDLPPVAPMRNRVQEIRKAAMRASALSQQMLAYSGKGQFVIQPLSLNDLIEQMRHLLQASLSKKTSLTCRLAEDLPAIEADAAQMRQLVMNLVTNASEALGESGGTLSLRTGMVSADSGYLAETYLNDDLPPGRYIFLEIADDGCGMDEPTKARIFDPFFTTKFAGRGLGLPAVLGIARGHRGAVRIESQPGHGTTVTILFPCSNRTATPASAHGLHGLNWEGTQTILVVDDEQTVREVAQTALARFGFNVLTASDGREALDLFRRSPEAISLVLLDLTMPRMDGEETFRALRRTRPDTRVILTSGYNEQVIAQRFGGQGLSGFLQKPFRLATLLAKVRAALGEAAREAGGER